MRLTFKKEERLCSRRLIDRLYSEGHRMMVFPYSVQWQLVVNEECGMRNEELDNNSSFLIPHSSLVLIVAPKRRLHHAVDRNRVKRLTRECWRRVKPQLNEELSARKLTLFLSLSYVHTEPLPYAKLMAAQEKLVQQLLKEIARDEA